MAKKELIRTKESCGADQTTPSKAEYFTWLNNTNEGSTQAQTLANLDFFAYLKREYGMQLDIYAWDAGNLDGAREHYAHLIEDSLKKQYPNGYKPVVDFAAKNGIRMGIWGGTDGYGKTKKEENDRRERLVHLCRDYNFALFKFDRACGTLRRSKRKAFAQTMQQCRFYSPDLILLLHRNKVGDASIYATTDLWQRKETYVDANSYNDCTAPHHRAFAFTRGLTPNLDRLMEDHGVCINSHNDYFEDDIVMQAFSRCLILSPEIYGNPFFLKDEEYPILARLFNLHRKYRDILVNGIELPEEYGYKSVVRGNGERRFLITSNPTWQEKTIDFTIDERLGLSKEDKIVVLQHFPLEKKIGEYHWGEKVSITLSPFRAAIIELVHKDKMDFCLRGCEYMVIHEKGGIPDKVRILKAEGDIYKENAEKTQKIATFLPFDYREKPPILLGSMEKTSIPPQNRKLYESAMFAVNNDSMERQSILRAGKSAIPEVEKAREFFFNQESYVLSGCESSAMFDGNPDTYFDKKSLPFVPTRIEGGCLRVDFGKNIYIKEIEIEYFVADKYLNGQFPRQTVKARGEYSTDLSSWKFTKKVKKEVIKRDLTLKYIVKLINNTEKVSGKMCKATYKIEDYMRYFALPSPMYRIHSFIALDGEGNKIDLIKAKANNLMAHYSKKKTKIAYHKVVNLPENTENTYLAIAVKGKHGKEGVYCMGICENEILVPYDRAPGYPAAPWQHEVVATNFNNTYYISLSKENAGKSIDLYALFNTSPKLNSIDIYLCDKHLSRQGVELSIE